MISENDFLGIMIKHKDREDNVSISNLISITRIDNLDCSYFIKELQGKKMIRYIDTDTYHLNPIAFSVYQSPAKKVQKLAFDFSKFTLKRLTDFAVWVAVGVISTCIAQHFIR